MLTEREARQRVARGAALLDSRWPDWFKYLDVKSLDMSEDCGCVLGQLTGSYNRERHRLFPASATRRIHAWFADEATPSQADAVEHGFDVGDYEFKREREADYETLKAAWIDAIAARTAKVTRSLFTPPLSVSARPPE